jgi:hypothetical protein
MLINMSRHVNKQETKMPPARADRHIKIQTDFPDSQFPDDKGGVGLQNIGLLTIKLFNTADSPRTFYPV